MGDLEKQALAGKMEAEEEKLVDGVAVLDFDLLCSTVALQTQGKWRKLESDDFDANFGNGGELGGVLRMWEGEILDCFDDCRVAIESLCCPCQRFGKNMRRAGFGSCFIQGTVYYIIALTAFLNFVAFIFTKRQCFLYLAAGFIISIGIYLGFFRTQIRKKFNIRNIFTFSLDYALALAVPFDICIYFYQMIFVYISALILFETSKGTESSLDDFIYHIFCPCCALSQESRTLEMNNVQDGLWHGRGDTICIGSINEGNKAIFELHPPPTVSIKSAEICSVQLSADIVDQS